MSGISRQHCLHNNLIHHVHGHLFRGLVLYHFFNAAQLVRRSQTSGRPVSNLAGLQNPGTRCLLKFLKFCALEASLALLLASARASCVRVLGLLCCALAQVPFPGAAGSVCSLVIVLQPVFMSSHQHPSLGTVSGDFSWNISTTLLLPDTAI